MVEQSLKRVVIDIELAYDFWSLMFCIARQVVNNNNKSLSLTNTDYSHIVNKSVYNSLRSMQQAYELSEDHV